MLSISLDTLVAVSPLLGEEQEDRAAIREAQDPALVERVGSAASAPMPRFAAEGRHFVVAPLDILVSRGPDGRPRFQLAELNGTGIGGLTNMTPPAVAAVLDAMADLPAVLPSSDAGSPPLILVASSGRENRQAPRVNRLYYEKILYADSLARGFAHLRGERADILGLESIARRPDWKPQRPTIVLGHFRELAEATTCDADGRLRFLGAPVSATVNDRFCLNLAKRYDHRIDLERWFTANRCFVAGADKGTAYDLSNRLLAEAPPTAFPSVERAIPFDWARSADELFDTVRSWLRQGRRPVIKPRATGLGHGIEFFLDPHEPEASIRERIDRSIAFVDDHYDFQKGGLPYTVCEYLDTACVPDPTHDLYGHKFELRVVVYRDGSRLRPFPSIAKVSCERFDAASLDRSMLINNVTASSGRSRRPGCEFALPLSNEKTLASLEIEMETLDELCRFCTAYVGSVLQSLEPKAAAPKRQRATAASALVSTDSDAPSLLVA